MGNNNNNLKPLDINFIPFYKGSKTSPKAAANYFFSGTFKRISLYHRKNLHKHICKKLLWSAACFDRPLLYIFFRISFGAINHYFPLLFLPPFLQLVGESPEFGEESSERENNRERRKSEGTEMTFFCLYFVELH